MKSSGRCFFIIDDVMLQFLNSNEIKMGVKSDIALVGLLGSYIKNISLTYNIS